MMSLRINRPLASILACGLVLIVLTRLPQFLGGRLVPDGDECVLGIMAKHLLDGRTFPVFYYGQNYGFSLFEVWTTAMLFVATGISGFALKSAMLLVWTVGWLFLVLAVRNFAGTRAAVIAGLLLIFCPAWGLGSMKARGGYLTAFALSNLFLWLLSRPQRSHVVFAVFGACLGLIYFSQPIWAVGIAPFAVLLLRKPLSLHQWAAFAGGIGLTVLPLLWVQSNLEKFSWVIDPFGNRDILLMTRHLPFHLWVQFTGVYPFSDWYDAGPATTVAATLWMLLLVLCSWACARRLIHREAFGVPQAAMASCLLVIAFSLIVNFQQFGFRYLLPLNGFLVIAAAMDMDARMGGMWRRPALTLIAAIVLTAAGSFLESARVPSILATEPAQRTTKRDADAINALTRELNQCGIRNVYCFHPMFGWNIVFDSQETILARWTETGGRWPEYGLAVDLALLTGGKVAVVGDIGLLPELKKFLAAQGYGRPEIRTVHDAFFILPNPPPKLVVQLGFHLHDPAELQQFAQTHPAGIN
jgi:hypothetical protein